MRGVAPERRLNAGTTAACFGAPGDGRWAPNMAGFKFTVNATPVDGFQDRGAMALYEVVYRQLEAEPSSQPTAVSPLPEFAEKGPAFSGGGLPMLQHLFS
jgi:hypothetical protein